VREDGPEGGMSRRRKVGRERNRAERRKGRGRERELESFFQTLFKLCKLHSNKHKSTMQPKDDAQALVAFKIVQNDI
jgi:hypothetical protein